MSQYSNQATLACPDEQVRSYRRHTDPALNEAGIDAEMRRRTPVVQAEDQDQLAKKDHARREAGQFH